MKRLLELIFMDYINNIENPVEIETNQIISNKTKSEILEKFKISTKTESKEAHIKEGNVFLFFKEHIPIHFLILEKLGNLYEVLKVSNYYELANQSDMITKVSDETYIIETWNNFYLTEEEVKKSIYIGELSEEDFKILIDYLSGKISELPQDKRGLTVPLDENFYQIKFHRKESEIVREYKLRI